jgi:antitoxin CptB
MSAAKKPSDAARDRLRWQCRRSMLELDLAFERFLDNGYSRLNEQQREQFLQLLEYPDPTLLEWVMGKAQPDQGALAELVSLIRKADPLKGDAAVTRD